MKHSSDHSLKRFATNNWRVILAAGVTTAIVVGSNYYINKVSKPDSLYSALDYYGFTTDSQKEALEYLMRQASIISAKESLQDKFPVRKNSNDLVKDILEFVKLTQIHFTIRTGTQERWEINPLNWMKQNVSINYEKLKVLGFIDTIKPVNVSPDAICILGAAMTRMEKRVKYTELMLSNVMKAKNLILLAGERKVTVGVDGTKEQLEEIAKNFNISDLSKLTETHLIQEAYKRSSIFNKIPTYVIDTPARDLPRPTTQTTIMELITWLKCHPEVKSILFISNQPNAKYQEAIIKQVFKNNYSINMEVVGEQVEEKNDLQGSFEGLGTYIWAQTPEVLLKLGKTIDNPELLKSFQELYAKNPLIYNNTESLFKVSGNNKSR